MKLNYLYAILIAWFLFSCSNDDYNADEKSPLEVIETDTKTNGLEVAVIKMKNSINTIKSNATTARSTDRS